MVLGKSAIKSGFAHDQTSNMGNGACGLFYLFAFCPKIQWNIQKLCQLELDIDVSQVFVSKFP